jgi:hypothetical protein
LIFHATRRASKPTCSGSMRRGDEIRVAHG